MQALNQNTTASNNTAVGFFLREDLSTELEGTGTLVVTPESRYIVEVPTQFLVEGDVLIINGHHRVAQSVSPSGGISSIHLDRAMPDEPIFSFLRDDPRFEEVMCYFHIDHTARYLAELGYDAFIPAPLLVNVNGIEADMSFFSPHTGTLTTGTACMNF